MARRRGAWQSKGWGREAEGLLCTLLGSQCCQLPRSHRTGKTPAEDPSAPPPHPFPHPASMEANNFLAAPLLRKIDGVLGRFFCFFCENWIPRESLWPEDDLPSHCVLPTRVWSRLSGSSSCWGCCGGGWRWIWTKTSSYLSTCATKWRGCITVVTSLSMTSSGTRGSSQTRVTEPTRAQNLKLWPF